MLKEKLKAALKAAGLNEELAETINITSEAQIEGAVLGLQSTQSTQELDFNTVLGSSEFARFVTKSGFDNVIKLSKSLQSEHDKKVTAGIKTFQEKWLKKANGEGDPGEGGEGSQQQNGDMPAWAKQLMDKVDSFEKMKTKTSKLEQAKETLKKSTILNDALKNSWASRIDLESETSFEDQVKVLETEFQELHTAIVGDASGKGLPFGNRTTTETEKLKEVGAMAEDFVSKRKK
jgi:hypothetical protein